MEIRYKNRFRPQEEVTSTINLQLIEYLRQRGCLVTKIPKPMVYEGVDGKDYTKFVSRHSLHLLSMTEDIFELLREYLGLPEDIKLELSHKEFDNYEDEIKEEEFSAFGYEFAPGEIGEYINDRNKF